MQFQLGTKARWMCAIALFAMAVYPELFLYRTFGPELPLQYATLQNVRLSNVLDAFTDFHRMWYRPLSTEFPYWIALQFINWHDLVAWKLLHFSFAAGTALAIYVLVLKLSPGSHVAGAFAAAYFLINPSLAVALMDLSNFDFIYVLCSLLSIVYFVKHWRGRKARTLVLSVVWFVCALASKELAIAVPVLVFAAILIFRRYPLKSGAIARPLVSDLRLLLPYGIVVLTYLFLHVRGLGARTAGSAYRVSPDWSLILHNAYALPSWVLHFYWKTGPFGRFPHDSLVNNLIGIAFLGIIVYTCARFLWRDEGLRGPILFAIAALVIFLPIPIYSGGSLWHIYLAIPGYAILFGLTGQFWLGHARPSGFRWEPLATLAAGLLILGMWNLHDELRRGTHSLAYRLNNHLLDAPPLPGSEVRAGTSIYVEDTQEIGPWWYGCYGSLFRFVYLEPEIRETVVPKLPATAIPILMGEAYLLRYSPEAGWFDASGPYRADPLTRTIDLGASARMLAPEPLDFIPFWQRKPPSK